MAKNNQSIKRIVYLIIGLLILLNVGIFIQKKMKTDEFADSSENHTSDVGTGTTGRSSDKPYVPTVSDFKLEFKETIISGEETELKILERGVDEKIKRSLKYKWEVDGKVLESEGQKILYNFSNRGNVACKVTVIGYEIILTENLLVLGRCSTNGSHNFGELLNPGEQCETCFDKKKNGKETGVDCGGNCPKDCPEKVAAIVRGCTNPQAHNYNKFATESDGSCETCYDDKMNGLETAIDCGGPCRPCPNQKRDTDGDGVNDDIDNCPNERGPIANNGCPKISVSLDTDKDGVPDDKDKCPNEKGERAYDGCPKAPEVVRLQKRGNLGLAQDIACIEELSSFTNGPASIVINVKKQLQLRTISVISNSNWKGELTLISARNAVIGSSLNENIVDGVSEINLTQLNKYLEPGKYTLKISGSGQLANITSCLSLNAGNSELVVTKNNSFFALDYKY